MRSRERLVDVLSSVNDRVHGDIAGIMHMAAECVAAVDIMRCPQCAMRMQWLSASHWSPHIRELAEQALYYFDGGKSP